MSSRETALSVNLNKVALIRNTRPSDVPSLEKAALLSLATGAHGLTAHPRPDGRHIRPDDIPLLASVVARHEGRELNLEGNPFSDSKVAGARADYPGFGELVARGVEAGGVHQVTLVPDAPGQSTSDHGWDLRKDAGRLTEVVARFRAMGCRVSLFLDPDPTAMELARETGADRVELYTEPYARAFDSGRADGSLALYSEAAQAANEAGLAVNAGHDLNLDNLGPFVRHIAGIEEVSIGHALIADALWMGLELTVRAYLDVLASRGN